LFTDLLESMIKKAHSS